MSSIRDIVEYLQNDCDPNEDVVFLIWRRKHFANALVDADGNELPEVPAEVWENTVCQYECNDFAVGAIYDDVREALQTAHDNQEEVK